MPGCRGIRALQTTTDAASTGHSARSPPVASTRVDQAPVVPSPEAPSPSSRSSFSSWLSLPEGSEASPPRRPSATATPTSAPSPSAIGHPDADLHASADGRRDVREHLDGRVPRDDGGQRLGVVGDAGPADRRTPVRHRSRTARPRAPSCAAGAPTRPRDRQHHRPGVVADRPRERGRGAWPRSRPRATSASTPPRACTSRCPATKDTPTPKDTATTYLFGFDDVRWAVTKADVTAYVKAPTEAATDRTATPRRVAHE